MNLPMLECFEIEDLAQRWNVHTDVIHRYLATGQLKGSFKNSESCAAKDIVWRDMNREEWTDYTIYILKEEVESWEKEYGQTSTASKPEYLDPDHPCYSEELAEAVEAWEYAVKHGATVLNFKGVVTERLKKAGYSGTTLDRLAVVTNPLAAKKGGAPKKEP